MKKKVSHHPRPQSHRQTQSMGRRSQTVEQSLGQGRNHLLVKHIMSFHMMLFDLNDKFTSFLIPKFN